MTLPDANTRYKFLDWWKNTYPGQNIPQSLGFSMGLTKTAQLPKQPVRREGTPITNITPYPPNWGEWTPSRRTTLEFNRNPRGFLESWLGGDDEEDGGRSRRSKYERFHELSDIRGFPYERAKRLYNEYYTPEGQAQRKALAAQRAAQAARVAQNRQSIFGALTPEQVDYYEASPEAAYVPFVNKMTSGQPLTPFGGFLKDLYTDLYTQFQAQSVQNLEGQGANRWIDFLSELMGPSLLESPLYGQFRNLPRSSRGFRSGGFGNRVFQY